MDSVQYKNVLLSYTALSWDISFLYLYQCLEDKFVYESIKSFHNKLNSNITPQRLGQMLYDELAWQPKDLESINKIIEHCSEKSECIKMFKSICGDQNIGKYIYTMRNRIVHETRETIIPLSDNENWDKAIAGMIYLLNEI